MAGVLAGRNCQCTIPMSNNLEQIMKIKIKEAEQVDPCNL